MRPTDTHILEFLQNEGNSEIVAPPAVIAENIGFQQSSVRERVTPLRRAGLIEYYDESAGYYQITELGRRYLNGELAQNEIDEIESILISA